MTPAFRSHFFLKGLLYIIWKNQVNVVWMQFKNTRWDFIISGCNIQEREVVFVHRSQKVQQQDKQVEV